MSGGGAELESMLELFRSEAEHQVRVLTAALLALETDPRAATELEQCMRAAHSLKGAARIVGVPAAASLAHVMEDGFVAAQRGSALLEQRQIDWLLQGVDWLQRIAQTPAAELGAWSAEREPELQAFIAALQRELADAAEPAAAARAAAAPQLPSTAGVAAPAREPATLPVAAVPSSAEPGLAAREAPAPPASPPGAGAPSPAAPPAAGAPPASAGAERALRLTAENLNRLLGLAGQALVESRWLEPFAAALLRLARMQHACALSLEGLGAHCAPAGQPALAQAQQRLAECRQFLAQRVAELESYSRRSGDLSQRLYREALGSRVRPFADAVGGLPRMVRDVGRSLGKSVRLEISGRETPVDRDLLELLDAPLNHLLRNAVDHGIEPPEQRLAAGKPAEAVLRLDARHGSGLLQISVADDGRGVPLEDLRRRVVAQQLARAQTAAQLSDAELLEFLFLPGFSLKDRVDEISGRGVGLDVVQHAVKQVRGGIRVHTEAGRGTRFQLQLPLTLSVVRALLVQIGGEAYAFPLAHVSCTLALAARCVEQLEGRQHFAWAGKRVSLVSAQQLLGRPQPPPADSLPVVVIGDAEHLYGLRVDGVLGERELVVQRLDPRFGKIKDVAAGALLDDGTPLLILDVEDLIRSADKLAHEGALDRARAEGASAAQAPRKCVLVVDDSLTVRELERKLLAQRGYSVQVAVDGMDGWNAVRMGGFDLVITDVDMPRLDGIELVTLIRADRQLQGLPVMIVSYKDREEDRQRGLEAGADYYLTKGSFYDERLLDAVADLIGGAAA